MSGHYGSVIQISKKQLSSFSWCVSTFARFFLHQCSWPIFCGSHIERLVHLAHLSASVRSKTRFLIYDPRRRFCSHKTRFFSRLCWDFSILTSYLFFSGHCASVDIWLTEKKVKLSTCDSEKKVKFSRSRPLWPIWAQVWVYWVRILCWVRIWLRFGRAGANYRVGPHYGSERPRPISFYSGPLWLS